MDRILSTNPSLLFGDRSEFRLLEGIGRVFAKLFSFLLIGRSRVYRGIHGRDVALAMIELLGTKSEKN